MKDRMIVAVGALGALAVVYVLFFQSAGEPPVTRPLSTAAGRNGYLGLRRWLEREGVAVVSLQERYDRLFAEELGLGPSGNVMITTMPHRIPLRLNEHEELQRWILEGNTLLILAALDDTPEWSSYAVTTNFLRDLGWITQLDIEAGGGDGAESGGASEARSIAAGTWVELRPATAHPLMAGVESLYGFSDHVSVIWSASSYDPGALVLRLASESGTGLDAMWQIPRGEGQIILAASGTLLSNDNIDRGDAPRFVANLIRYHLASGSAVVFDDMHQGLSTLYDAAAFFRDPRLHATLWWVIAAWLVYVLGSTNRFAPPAAVNAAPRQGDFLAAAGGFMARRLDRRAAGLLLMNEWFDEVRRARRLARHAEPPWRELQATPALSDRTLRELRRCHERMSAGRSVDLARLDNLLKQAREASG